MIFAHIMAFIMAFCLTFLTSIKEAMAEWTPLIDSGAFSGMRSDVMTAVGGVMSIVIIIIGAALIIRALTR